MMRKRECVGDIVDYEPGGAAGIVLTGLWRQEGPVAAAAIILHLL
jgi:hypothetical protein